MDSSISPALRQWIVDALAVVAADAPDQAAWVERHGVVVDEIALNYDDALRALDGPIGRGRIDAGLVDALREIDGLFASMSGIENGDRWTGEALAGDCGWERARRLARGVLVELTGTADHPLPVIRVIH